MAANPRGSKGEVSTTSTYGGTGHTLNIRGNKRESDRENNYKPICIIGNLGTVNTGAVDDLNALANIAKQQNMWFHIDGAFGALTKIAPKSNHLADGITQADSIAFDFHKWMYVNYAAGCVLVKSAKDHYRTFALSPAYCSQGIRG